MLPRRRTGGENAEALAKVMNDRMLEREWRGEADQATSGEAPSVSVPPDGVGPLLERDYWAVIAGCRFRPSEIAELVAARFTELAPPELVEFRRVDGSDAPLTAGDELEVDIRMAGSFGVRVVHRDRNSLTLATLAGHPEVGRITFGAYRNDVGDVVFHIRSRARSRAGRRLGFLAVGEAMQTNTWTDFIGAVAATTGDGVAEAVHAETRSVEEEAEDRAAVGPTYHARSD